MYHEKELNSFVRKDNGMTAITMKKYQDNLDDDAVGSHLIYTKERTSQCIREVQRSLNIEDVSLTIKNIISYESTEDLHTSHWQIRFVESKVFKGSGMI